MNAILSTAQIHSKRLPDLVNKLLIARQESLVLFHRLAALHPFADGKPVQYLLQRFRQSLVDYLALGPFEVYEALEAQLRNSPYSQTRALARPIYARIARTTQAALDFHDRYEGAVSKPALATLDQDLSRLGESLATRIELEDRIVAAVRNSRVRLAA